MSFWVELLLVISITREEDRCKFWCLEDVRSLLSLRSSNWFLASYSYLFLSVASCSSSKFTTSSSAIKESVFVFYYCSFFKPLALLSKTAKSLNRIYPCLSDSNAILGGALDEFFYFCPLVITVVDFPTLRSEDFWSSPRKVSFETHSICTRLTVALIFVPLMGSCCNTLNFPLT